MILSRGMNDAAKDLCDAMCAIIRCHEFGTDLHSDERAVKHRRVYVEGV